MSCHIHSFLEGYSSREVVKEKGVDYFTVLQIVKKWQKISSFAN